jgi:predicted nucleic acid-binding Zn ribbon protein
MAPKSNKSRPSSKPKRMSYAARQVRRQRILFIVISVILLLSMVLTLVIKY